MSYEGPTFLDARLPDRFWSKVQPCPMTGCWIWVGATTSDGYGQIKHLRRQDSAHRLFFEALRGPIPDGLHIDHRCRVRCCVNPAHLEPVTPRENVLRGVGHVAALSRATHCKHGHEFNLQNTYVRPQGRTCRACHASRMRLRRVGGGSHV